MRELDSKCGTLFTAFVKRNFYKILTMEQNPIVSICKVIWRGKSIKEFQLLMNRSRISSAALSHAVTRT